MALKRVARSMDIIHENGGHRKDPYNDVSTKRTRTGLRTRPAVLCFPVSYTWNNWMYRSNRSNPNPFILKLL